MQLPLAIFTREVLELAPAARDRARQTIRRLEQSFLCPVEHLRPPYRGGARRARSHLHPTGLAPGATCPAGRLPSAPSARGAPATPARHNWVPGPVAFTFPAPAAPTLAAVPRRPPAETPRSFPQCLNRRGFANGACR